LLIAGAHAPATFWPDFFCEELTKHFFVIRFDHRDIGYSTHFPEITDIQKPIYTIKDLVQDILAILDTYQIRRAIVIGHSLGGMIVQYLAAFHSNRILKAISMSANITNNISEHPKYQETMQELLKNKPTGNFEHDWPSWKHSWKVLNGNYPIDEQLAKQYTHDIYTRHEGDFNPAWNQIAATMTKLPLKDKLPENLILIHGTEDVLAPAEEIITLQKENKFNIHFLEGAGHVFLNRKIWVEILKIVLKLKVDIVIK